MKIEEVVVRMKEGIESLARNDKYTFLDIIEEVKRGAAEIPQDHPIHGEINLVNTLMYVKEPEVFLELLQRAKDKLKRSSDLLPPHNADFDKIVNLYEMWGEKPGVADLTCSDDGYYAKIYEGLRETANVAYGLLELMKGQLAYYRGEFDKAYAHIMECRKQNEKAFYSESIIDVYALEILVGIGKYNMDVDLWNKSYNALRLIADGKMNSSRAACENAQVVCTMIDLSLGILHDAPSWGKTGDIGAIPAPWGFEMLEDGMLASIVPGAMLAHIEYLAFNGEFSRALMSAGTLKDVFGYRNVMMSSYLELLRADCYIQLNKPRRANEAIENAMQYIIPDKLYVIAAEFMHYFGDQILAVAAAHSQEAADRISELSDNYDNKVSMLRSAMLKTTNEELTRREREIVVLAIEGCSNAEIAEKLNITIRTVRAHLEHIFDKFGVSRRSQLVTAIGKSQEKHFAHWVK